MSTGIIKGGKYVKTAGNVTPELVFSELTTETEFSSTDEVIIKKNGVVYKGSLGDLLKTAVAQINATTIKQNGNSVLDSSSVLSALDTSSSAPVNSTAVNSALGSYVKTSSVVDSVADGNMNPVTSNAVAEYVSTQKFTVLQTIATKDSTAGEHTCYVLSQGISLEDKIIIGAECINGSSDYYCMGLIPYRYNSAYSGGKWGIMAIQEHNATFPDTFTVRLLIYNL